MTMLKIQQLASTEYNITLEQQHQVRGGGAGPHNNPSSSSSSRYIPLQSSTELWSGYADTTYDVGAGIGDNVNFIKDNGKLAGVIDGSGNSLRLANSDYAGNGY